MDEKWTELYSEIGELRLRTAVIADLLMHYIANETDISPEMLIEQVRSKQLQKFEEDFPDKLNQLHEPQNSQVVAMLMKDNRDLLETLLHFQTRIFARSNGIPVADAEQMADDIYQRYSGSDEATDGKS